MPMNSIKNCKTVSATAPYIMPSNYVQYTDLTNLSHTRSTNNNSTILPQMVNIMYY